jgi:putative CocE/NonD family hydrolase
MNVQEPSIDCGDGVRLIRGRTMRTRDGISLVSDHYLPPGDKPAPTLLMRQPYGRDIASTVVYAHPIWFARHGYHVIIQDVRGTGDSEGDFYPFRSEALDGYDTVQWAADLAESNGRVAMYGFSYQALTQLLAAVEQPPALVAIAPGMAAGDLFHGWFYTGGMFKLASGVGWGTQMLRYDALRLGLPEASDRLNAAWRNMAAHTSFTPYASVAHLTAAGLPSYYSDWVTHDEPGPYWEKLDISSHYDRIIIPALHIAGWYDTYGEGSIDTFDQLSRHAGSDKARKNQYLVAGPWQHIPWSNLVGETDFGPDAVLETDQLLLRWFNHWMKDDGSFEKEPKARLFVLGENRWHALETWLPSERSEEREFYLGSLGRANSRHGDGTLSSEPSTGMGPRDILVSDPDVPVPAPGPGAAPGAYCQDRLEAGNNVLVYTSPLLEEKMHVCGRPRVSLQLSSSREECDLVAKLVRVDRNGRAWNISLGAARAKRLFVSGQLRADEICLWEFSLDTTSCVFQTGERIRLEVAGTAFPLLDRSSNRVDVPAALAGPGRWSRVTHQVLHDKDHPSKLILPLLADS